MQKHDPVSVILLYITRLLLLMHKHVEYFNIMVHEKTGLHLFKKCLLEE